MYLLFTSIEPMTNINRKTLLIELKIQGNTDSFYGSQMNQTNQQKPSTTKNLNLKLCLYYSDYSYVLIYENVYTVSSFLISES